jgi:hypothetical protein
MWSGTPKVISTASDPQKKVPKFSDLRAIVTERRCYPRYPQKSGLDIRQAGTTCCSARGQTGDNPVCPHCRPTIRIPGNFRGNVMQRLTELQRAFSRGTARVTHPAGTHAATSYPRKTLASSPEVAASQPTLPRVLSPQHSSFLEAGLVATQRLRMAQNHCHGSWSHGVPASWDSVWLSGALGILGRRLQSQNVEDGPRLSSKDFCRAVLSI